MRKTNILHYLPVFFILITLSGFSQNLQDALIYCSPRPGAQMVMPGNNIAFRLDPAAGNISKQDIQLQVTGSVSGEHTGTLKLADDQSTWIFKPHTPYEPDEKVTATLLVNRFWDKGKSWWFHTSRMSPDRQKKILAQLRKRNLKKVSVSTQPFKNTGPVAINDSLPEGFPEITTTHWNNPSPGYIFITPLSYEIGSYYLIMLDNYRTPVFYRELPVNGAFDFKLQPNGLLSYYAGNIWQFVVMNSSFEVIDTIGAGNGYSTDIHELRMYENGHAFLLSYDPQIVDMSQIVPGGYEEAVVTGLVVQELDADEEVVFQWRSWDHYEITNASNWIDLTDTLIDYVHGNSIEIVSDSEMLISSRNMNEITKIDRNTGDIIWRLNGEENMFTFTEPVDSFCVQHSIRLMPDSTNISVFDNGGCHSPQISSAMEFALDEDQMTATLESKFRSDPDIFGSFMGNTQRLLNGHTINGWGSGIPSVTEFDSAGNILLEFSFPYLNYRAFKFDWQHDIFHAEPALIQIDTLHQYDTTYTTFSLYNTSDHNIEINRLVNRVEGITITNNLPVIIGGGASADLEVMIIGTEPGAWDDDLTLCWEINSDTLVQRIATQVSLSGFIKGEQSVSETAFRNHFNLYPNPSSGSFTLQSQDLTIAGIRVTGIDGAVVSSMPRVGEPKVTFGNALKPGIYFVEIRTGSGKIFTTKVIKQ